MKVYQTSTWVRDMSALDWMEVRMKEGNIPYAILERKSNRHVEYALFRKAFTSSNLRLMSDGELEDLLKKFDAKAIKKVGVN